MLTDVHTVDWQSLTFTGERHQIELRVPRPGSRARSSNACADGLEDAEFSIPGQIVADIAVPARRAWDGRFDEPHIEALTIAAD